MSIRNQIFFTVPDIALATDWFTQIIGPPVGGGNLFFLDSNISVKLGNCTPSKRTVPSVLDIGTLHLCFRVANIERVASAIDDLEDTRVLGDIVDILDGPIQGNRWVYFRAPWGALFELQEWQDPPAYYSRTKARLYHGHPMQRPGALPGIRGLDHAGYSVSNLPLAIGKLTVTTGGKMVLRTTMSVDADFTYRHFGIYATSTSQMAMVAVDGVNIELFEHGTTDKNPPRAVNELGGHKLTLGRMVWAGDLSAGAVIERDKL